MVENHTLECADISEVRIYYTKQTFSEIFNKMLPYSTLGEDEIRGSYFHRGISGCSICICYFPHLL